MNTEIIFTEKQREALKAYKQEAFENLSDIETAKNNLKEIYEAAAEATGVEKKVVSKLYNTLFKEKLSELADEVELLQFLAGE